jgi:hypothetical protein
MNRSRRPTEPGQLRVQQPAAGIPENNPNGRVCQSNGAAVEQMLRELCPEGSPRVDPRSGRVSVDPVAGGPHAQTCAMLTEMTHPANDWTIELNDQRMPVTRPDRPRDGTNGRGTGGRVIAESPNGPTYGYSTAEGQEVDFPPSGVLGHELFGHAPMVDRGVEPMLRTARAEGGHDAAVSRENRVNAEQGRPARGMNLDAYCGESYVRTGPDSVRYPSLAACEQARAETHPETPITAPVPAGARPRR